MLMNTSIHMNMGIYKLTITTTTILMNTGIRTFITIIIVMLMNTVMEMKKILKKVI